MAEAATIHEKMKAETTAASECLKSDINNATRAWELKLATHRHEMEEYRLQQANKCGEHSAQVMVLKATQEETLKTLSGLKEEFFELRKELLDILKERRKS